MSAPPAPVPPLDPVPAAQAAPPPARTRLSPKKLLLSKWTAVVPLHKEKHFVVTRVLLPDPPDAPVNLVELEAVHSRRSTVLPWRALTDASRWRQGWV